MQYNRRLAEMLPNYYEELLESREMLIAEDVEFNVLYSRLFEVLLQFRISTSTWGIVYWENLAGIQPNESISIDERRSNVIAKIRGARPVTIPQIKSICESYSGGTVDVTEDNANYTVLIKFVDTLGQPSGIDTLLEILREVIPAHIAISYEFTYNSYKDYAPIPYSEITQFTYEELLTLALEYEGSTNMQIESSTNQMLEQYTNEELLGGF